MSGLLGKSNIGGSTGKAYAAISVTYPVGSVCTCSNGSKTLKAKDTSGSFLFLVPFGGNWVITVTDGTRTAQKTVTINAGNRSANLSISYSLTIISNGDVLIPMENRMGSVATPTWTKSGNYRVVGITGGRPGGRCTTNKIDLAPYSKLRVTAYTDQRLRIGVGSSFSASTDDGVLALLPSYVSVSTSLTTLELDLSSYNGLYYIGCIVATSAMRANGYIKDLELIA